MLTSFLLVGSLDYLNETSSNDYELNRALQKIVNMIKQMFAKKYLVYGVFHKVSTLRLRKSLTHGWRYKYLYNLDYVPMNVFSSISNFRFRKSGLETGCKKRFLINVTKSQPETFFWHTLKIIWMHVIVMISLIYQQYL